MTVDSNQDIASGSSDQPAWLAQQQGYSAGGAYGSYVSCLGRAYFRRHCEVFDREIILYFGSRQHLDVLEVGCGAGHPYVLSHEAGS